MGTQRKCRWFNRDNIDEKNKLNSHITEIGMKCLETCGCLRYSTDTNSTDTLEENEAQVPPEPVVKKEECVDERGAWETNEGQRKQCDWLDRFRADERKELNCGITEIGLKCRCRCPKSDHDPLMNVLVQDLVWDYSVQEYNIGPSTPPTEKPKAPRKSKGRFNDAGDILTLIPYADATVSQQNKVENFGEFPILRIDKPDNSMQSLLLFDLTLVAESFGAVIGTAILRLYATSGSSFGGVSFKKMAEVDWRESRVTWNNMPGGEGLDEPIISFLDSIDSQEWYDVDVTIAVIDALENKEPYLGIRVVSDEAEITFASKESEDLQPQLIIDSRTKAPTIKPTNGPTRSPTSSPAVQLDCLDHKGTFVSHTGVLRSCSWFDVGNGQLKKELNCQGSSEAALFCQSQCSAFNGCDDLTCEDKSGAYLSNNGVRQNCSWLSTGRGK